MLNQIEVALWLDSPVTKTLLKILKERLEYETDLLTQGYTLNQGSVEVDTAKAVGKIEILDLIVNKHKETLGVVEIEE